MNTSRKIAIMVGVFYIVATVAGMLSLPFTQPILDAPDYLINVSANEVQVILGALGELILAVAVAGIAIAVYPVLKKHNSSIAIGYFGARIVESLIFMIAVIRPTNTIDTKSGICESRSSGRFLFSNFRRIITGST